MDTYLQIEMFWHGRGSKTWMTCKMKVCLMPLTVLDVLSPEMASCLVFTIICHTGHLNG